MIDDTFPFGAPPPHVSSICPHTASIGITRFHIKTSYLEWDIRAASIFAAAGDDRPALDIWRSRVHPDDTHLLSDLYSDARASIGAECIYRIQLPDNTIRFVLTRSVAVEQSRDGTPEILTGVVSLLPAQNRAVTGDRLTAILDNVSLGFAIVDIDMTVLFVNAQTERHLGMARSDLVGRNLHEALPVFKGSYFDDLHRTAVATRSEVTVEVQALVIPGRTIEVTANYVDGVVAISFRDVSETRIASSRLLAAYRDLLDKSRLDDLTGVLNRSALFERIDRTTSATSPLSALLFIDLDDFKAINDTYGHPIGDHVLRTTAERLASACGPNVVLGRIGGDEFVAAVFGSTHSPTTIAEAMRSAVARPLKITDVDISVTISIGIATGTPSSTLEDLLTRADIALYEAKSGDCRISGTRLRRDERDR
ncbi:GGDEF domain-containing protein [Rhodococcoides trifolii]|nr:sensor domain-containing diguanylate cyclase [Rhodococcus trifolii]